MRDIRPNPISRRRRTIPDLPPEPEALLPIKAAAPKARFSGSHVPVTSVHVSKQIVPKKRRDVVPAKKHEIMALAEEEIVAEMAEAKQTKRPLFVKPPADAKPKKAPMRVGHKERIVLAALFALIIVAVGIAAYIFLPKADITLVIQSAPLLVDQKITLSGTGGDADTIPGSVLSRDVTVTGTAPVNSHEVVGTKATGTVQIINRTTQEQKIKDHSRLVTKDGILFYMQQAVDVPAGTSSELASATVNVIADQSGEQGNIAPQQLNFAALDSSSQTLVYAQNTAAFTGGSGNQVAVVKDDDITAAKKAAGDMAKSQAEQDIRAQLPKGWTILDESWDENVTDFQTDAKVGAQQTTISFTAKVTVRVMGYEDDKFQSRLSDVLKSKLDPSYMLFPGPISFTKSVDSIDWDKGIGNLSVRVRDKTIPTFSVDALKDKISGLSQSEAVNYLQGLQGVQSATVDLWPFWVHSIPTIAKRTNITIQSGN